MSDPSPALFTQNDRGEVIYQASEGGFIRGDKVTISLPRDSWDGKRGIVESVLSERTCMVAVEGDQRRYVVSALQHRKT